MRGSKGKFTVEFSSTSITKEIIDKASDKDKTTFLKEFYIPSEKLQNELKYISGEEKLKNFKFRKVRTHLKSFSIDLNKAISLIKG